MKKLHLICNTHLDPVWQWEWEEGAAAAVSTFRAAAEFCREYDGFVFNHIEALLYKWIEEYELSLFQEIRELVDLAAGPSWAVGILSPIATCLPANHWSGKFCSADSIS